MQILVAYVLLSFVHVFFQGDKRRNSAQLKKKNTLILNRDTITDTEGYSDLPAHEVCDLTVFFAKYLNENKSNCFSTEYLMQSKTSEYLHAPKCFASNVLAGWNTTIPLNKLLMISIMVEVVVCVI